jgi:hypothetical protein
MGDEKIAGFVIQQVMRDFNPNHKYKFLLFNPPDMRWIFNLGFAVRDESIYIAPQLSKEVTIRGSDAAGLPYAPVVPLSTDLHLSIHHSGVANLAAGGRQVQLRGETSQPFYGHLVTLSVKEASSLAPASPDYVNSLPGSYTVISVVGLPHQGPVFISVFRYPGDNAISPHNLGGSFQLNAECHIRGKGVKYLFAVWQNPSVPAFDADFAVSLTL